MILLLAEKYGQSPGDVENWDEFWFARAAVKLEAEGMDNARKNREMSRKK